MKTYIKVGDAKYAASVTTNPCDNSWGGRASRSITLEMSYSTAVALFVDDLVWSIIQERDFIREVPVDPLGETATPTFETVVDVHADEYDSSDFSIAGEIVDHRNGYITIKMGKPTAEEILALITEGLEIC